MAKKGLSRKELEEIKKRQDEEAAAQVFEQFVATFQEDSSKVSKVWIKAGTYDAGQRKEDTNEKGKLYKPMSKISEQPSTPVTKQKSREKDKSVHKSEKKKSNLELFKEELRAIQEEREERHRLKASLKVSRFEPPMPATPMSGPTKNLSTSAFSLGMEEKMGSYDVGDPNTTNIYLGNINPKMTEQQIMEIFGKYGPLASVKVMWPRTEEEKARNRNCGFVAYMNRKDAERAMKKLNGKDIMGFDMKLGWGKALPIPTRPIYVPPALLETTLPPPPTGLPFNALPATHDVDKIPPPGTPYPTHGEVLENFNKILSRAVVKVVIPTERNLLCLIHRMVEFVVREGPMFEAMMMNKEIDNPQFRFLFENRSPAHIYYRWKLYSILQGDAVNKWRTEDFRMFKGGSIWRPPSLNPFAQGMPDEMFSSDEEDEESRRRSLSKSQKKRLEQMLRKLTPERSRITDAMIFCIEHAEASDEIVDFIAESLNSLQTSLPKKLGRFFLVSDVLYNSSAKAMNASNFRSGFQSRLVEMVSFMQQTYENLESRLKAEAFKQRIVQCFRAWEDWNVYPPEFLIHLQNIFLGLTPANKEMEKSEVSAEEDVDGIPLEDPDLDGAPLSDSEDLDGVPLDGAALLRSAVKLKSATSPVRARPTPAKVAKYEDDIDGTPYKEDIDGVPLHSSSTKSRSKEWKAGQSSKWEIENPALASSKWDLEQENDSYDSSKRKAPSADQEDIFADPDTSRGTYDDEEPVDDSSQESNIYSSDSRQEDRRGLLREIELEVVRYQDELEAGLQNRVSGVSVTEQVQRFRDDLLRKAARGYSQDSGDKDSDSSKRERRDSDRRGNERSERSNKDRERHKRRTSSRSRSRSRSPKKSSRSKRGRSRSSSRSRRSPKRSRSRSGSPRKSRRSRSPSPSRKAGGSSSSSSRNVKKSKY